MNRPKVYIDGQAGTTGLQIYERLKNREDIELLLIQKDKRKDNTERRKMFEKADLSILCLLIRLRSKRQNSRKGQKRSSLMPLLPIEHSGHMVFLNCPKYIGRK